MIRKILSLLFKALAVVCLASSNGVAAPQTKAPLVVASPSIDWSFAEAVKSPGTKPACSSLAPTRFQNAAAWRAAMAIAGNDWLTLSRVTISPGGSSRDLEILTTGYVLKCERTPSPGTPPLWVSIIVGIVTILVAAASLWWTRSSNRFANSVGLYRKYLELCVQYPELAEPVPDISPTNLEDYRRYEWFVGVLFRACDEVLMEGNRLPTWRKTVIEQLSYHHTYIKNSSWLSQGGLDIYSKRFREAIAEVKNGGGPKITWELPKKSRVPRRKNNSNANKPEPIGA